ncbi:Cytochrome P450 [Popillia japonica]|uniref:Cytochrome P450 n=1 Tax=Popillia japonica TaxID=7064 RepID=A0AAW1J1J9_POPJA
MASAFILACVAILAVFVYRYFKNKRFNELLNKLPSPPGLPVLGHVSKFKKLEGLMDMITEYVDEYDGIVLLRPGPTIKYFAVADHRLVEYLCNSRKVVKSKRYRLFERWLGRGIFTFTTEYDQWKIHRNLITPAFHIQVLEQFVPTFNSVTDVFLEKLSENVNKTVDIFELVNLCALDIIAETALGVPLHAQTNSFSKYVNSLEELLRIIAVRSFSALKVHDWIFRLTNDYDKETEALKVLKGYTNSVIDAKQNTSRSNGATVNGIDKKRRLAVLDLLLEKKGVLTESELSNLVEGIMFAGHDTSGVAMAALFYLIALHPEVQDKAFEELRDIYGNDLEREVTYKDLQEMKYLEMVAKEALRLFPPAPIISKQLLEDYEFNGYIIPKGLNALVSIHSIHRREKYFPNPNKFDPERFSPENQSNITPFSYLPFGLGPRNCVGQKFAMLEMKAVVSKVLRKFKFLPVDDFKLTMIPQIVQKPKNGIFLKVVRRQY